MKISRVLLIYLHIPEGHKAYLIENPSEEQLEHLSGANDKFINCDDTNDSMEYICKTLDSDWKNFEVELPVMNIDKVFISGFYM
jgi:hypothetical protein